MFIISLFTIARMWKQSKCPSADELIKQLWDTDTTEYSAIKKKESKRAHRHMKECSTSLAIREVQIKTIMRHHLTLVRMTIINKSTNTSAGKDVKKREP